MTRNSRAHMQTGEGPEEDPKPEMYRSIIDVVSVDGRNVEVYVSGWDPSRSVKLLVQQISDPKGLLAAGHSYLGMVNLGVKQERELQLTLLNEAPELDPNDGLA